MHEQLLKTHEKPGGLSWIWAHGGVGHVAQRGINTGCNKKNKGGK